MSNSVNRVLYLIKIFTEETDEDHRMSVLQLIEQLEKYNIKSDRQTIYSSIEILQDFGMDIVCVRTIHNEYFCGSLQLEMPELKLLVDAVASSKLISYNKSKVLIDKLSSLTSKHQAKDLNRDVFIHNRIKSDNEIILYIVDLIHSAITLKKQITFNYIQYDRNKKRVLKHNGQVYVFSPYDFICTDDRYYVLGYSESHGKIVTFRVDKIYKPNLISKDQIPPPENYSTAKYYRELFQMYDGKVEQVKLMCENELMDVIIDRFGIDVNTKVLNTTHFTATVNIAASPTFYGWIFQFAGKIRILSPQNIIDEYKNIALNL